MGIDKIKQDPTRLWVCNRCGGIFLFAMDDFCPICKNRDRRVSDAAGGMETEAWYRLIDFSVEIKIKKLW